MGYDMTLEKIPEDMVVAKAAHDRAFGDWLRAYQADKATRVEVPDDPTYFRLNIWGMGKYRELMDKFHMLATEYEMPPFNEIEVEDALAGEEPGIPIDKLCSNDGWLVRPEECLTALKAYEKFTRAEVKAIVAPEDLDYWDKWIDFIRLGAANGGFRVW